MGGRKWSTLTGILADRKAREVDVALHVARQLLRISHQVTLYTHNHRELNKKLSEAHKAAPAPITVDVMKTTKLIKNPEHAQVIFHFKGRTSKSGAFLTHKSKTKLELPERAAGEFTKQGGTYRINIAIGQIPAT
ncbi:hypothetical protein VM1G_11690 [Cytospora mali]|uniref:Uncharacterized protein n=1 Tax=Cytospora mali TaxID=578113 RepID=A0A194W216_CYTMA|nr:hypothetical protein VM1G_11690 [Valsa mali]